jgi:hypothetical protein
MADLEEQHICLKFFFWLGKNATETLEMLKVVFREQRMGRTWSFGVVFQVCEWHIIGWEWWSPSHQWRKQINVLIKWIILFCCSMTTVQHILPIWLLIWWRTFILSVSFILHTCQTFLFVSCHILGPLKKAAGRNTLLFWWMSARGSACSDNMGMSESMWKQAFWVLLCWLCY